MQHSVKVVEIATITPVPNTDTLAVTEIDGFPVVIRRDQWKPGDRGVYIEPDYVVPAAPWAALLGAHRRVRARRFRGVYSAGLLLSLDAVGLPRDTPVGTDVMARLGITRYEPFVEAAGAEDAPAPARFAHVRAYDLESWRAHRDRIPPDARVLVTEKLHGESARFVFTGGALHAGSRTRWKRRDGNSSWALALRANPWIEAWCRANPDCLLYGEVIGHVPRMAYGVKKGLRGFRAFDVWRDGAWAGAEEFLARVPANHRVPVLFDGPAGAVTAELAEGVSTLGPHVREGFVLKPYVERDDPELGRLALKCVGHGYHERGA